MPSSRRVPLLRAPPQGADWFVDSFDVLRKALQRYRVAMIGSGGWARPVLAVWPGALLLCWAWALAGGSAGVGVAGLAAAGVQSMALYCLPLPSPLFPHTHPVPYRL